MLKIVNRARAGLVQFVTGEHTIRRGTWQCRRRQSRMVNRVSNKEINSKCEKKTRAGQSSLLFMTIFIAKERLSLFLSTVSKREETCPALRKTSYL